MIGCPFGRRGIERRFCASKCWLIGLGVRTHCTVGRVKILHTAYRVTDLAASLDFYIALGYGEVGRVDIGDGASLTMLKFPGEEVVTLELVHRPASQPVSKRPVANAPISSNGQFRPSSGALAGAGVPAQGCELGG